MSMELKGKTAVITGAGSGFGLALARRCAREGMNLVLADVQADALARASSELAQVPHLSQRLDVSSGAEMATLAAAVQQRFGAPHLVFNNAGVAFGGLLWEASEADWDWVLGVNLRGVVHGVRLFTPMMLAAAKADPAYRGHIVNTASMAGVLNPPLSGPYNVSKHAVVSLSETLHHDLALVTEQLHCSVLCPYYVPTGIADSHRNRDPGTMSRATASQRVSHAMAQKAVTSGKLSADDIAALVLKAVHERQFWIFSHPHALEGVLRNAEDQVRGRNPADPFAAMPELNAQIRGALRG